MSATLVCAVWDRFPGGGSELSVLQAIAFHANERGSCYVPIASLAKTARVSPSTVSRVLKALRRERWIATDRIMGQGGTLIFQINIPKVLGSERSGLMQ